MRVRIAASEFVPEPHAELTAVARNEYCLAKNSGCFSCADNCEIHAIMVIPGTGIRIDEESCTGCHGLGEIKDQKPQKKGTKK